MSVDWITQTVRLSLFSNAPIAATEQDWQKITGQEEAESRTAIAAGGKMFSGKFEGGNLTFAYSGPRLDVVLSAEEKGGRWTQDAVFRPLERCLPNL